MSNPSDPVGVAESNAHLTSIKDRDFAISWFLLNLFVVIGLFCWGWRSVTFMCLVTGVSFFIGKWLTKHRDMHFVAAQAGTLAAIVGVCMANLPRSYLIDLQSTLGDEETIVLVTNVETFKNDCPTFVNVVGFIRTINPQGEFRDLPFTWASWSPGETKKVTYKNPFTAISRIEFHAPNSYADGLYFNRTLTAHWPLTPEEAALAKLRAELREPNTR